MAYSGQAASSCPWGIAWVKIGLHYTDKVHTLDCLQQPRHQQNKLMMTHKWQILWISCLLQYNGLADSQQCAIWKKRRRNRETKREKGKKLENTKVKLHKRTLSEPRVHSNLVCPTSLTFFRTVSGSNGGNTSALFTCLVRPQQPAAKLGHSVICTSKHLHNSQPHTGRMRKPHC